mgnify:CR=1 FL=1
MLKFQKNCSVDKLKIGPAYGIAKKQIIIRFDLH